MSRPTRWERHSGWLAILAGVVILLLLIYRDL